MANRRSIFISASEDRLEKLIKERLKHGSDKEKIDNRIWDLFGEEWSIMFTDLSGFSRGVEKFGIIHFLQTIHEAERILVPIIEEHDGILLKVEGDSFMIVFRNVKKAIQCAISMQKILKEYNLGKSDEEKILLCVGLGFGKVLKIGDSDVFGAEVNAASKLGEDIAKSWEILITNNVLEHAKDIPGLSFSEIPEKPPGADKAFKLIYNI